MQVVTAIRDTQWVNGTSPWYWSMRVNIFRKMSWARSSSATLRGRCERGDADDKGMKMLHKLPRSNLIAFANAIKTASQIKRLVVRHDYGDASSGTYCKTPVAPAAVTSRCHPAS